MPESPRMPGNTPESAVQRQFRIFVRADFRNDEAVRLSGQGTDGETLSEYLRRGRGSRFRSRLYNLVWLVLMLFTAGVVVAFVAFAEQAGIGLRIGVALFGLLLVAFGLRQLAGWRCMRRYRKAPHDVTGISEYDHMLRRFTS